MDKLDTLLESLETLIADRIKNAYNRGVCHGDSDKLLESELEAEDAILATKQEELMDQIFNCV
jgi:hypothetical protein